MILGIIGDLENEILFAKKWAESLERPLCLVDFRHENRNLEMEFQVEDEIVYDILDFLKRDCSLYQAGVEVEEEMDLISSSFKKDKYNPSKEDIHYLLEEIKKEYKTIILCGPLPEGSYELFDQVLLINRDLLGFEGEKFYVGQRPDKEEGIYLGKIPNKKEQDKLDLLFQRYEKREAYRSFWEKILRR